MNLNAIKLPASDSEGVGFLKLGEDPACGLDAALAALPRRCIFCNESVRVMLAGLFPGQATWEVTTPCQIILIVTSGELRIKMLDGEFTAEAGEVVTINSGVRVQISASMYADFLLAGGGKDPAVKKLGRCLELALFTARN